MKSVLKPILLLAMLLSASACATSNVRTPTEGCSSLVPADWKQPVPHADIGTTGDAALDAQLYALAETGQLNIANTVIVGGWKIVANCEARDAAAARRINGFWR